MHRTASAAAVLIVPFVISGVALAQTQQLPTKENRWAGKAHQPTQQEVTQQEQSAGVAPSPQQRQATDSEVQGLYEKLMKDTPSQH